MSFYSLRNAETEICPGRVNGDVISGLCERVCIEVKKVYDACLQQEQLDNVRIRLHNIQPSNENPVTPFEFVSCRSATSKAIIRDLTIERLADRENFARVRGVIEIPIEVIFLDARNREFSGCGVISIRKDVIMYVPNESIIPFEVSNLVSAVCVTGEYVDERTFNITVCVTIILKIVAEVDLLIPSYGFCCIPPCEEFAENVCDEFFGLPIFPPQLEDSGILC